MVKRAKKKTRKTVKRAVRSRTSKKAGIRKKVKVGGNRVGRAFKNLILFVFLSVVSFFLKSVSSDDFIINFFDLLTFIFAFIAVAFLIVWLVFLIMKGIRSK